MQGNNTLLLEVSSGWKGICVEPNTTFFAALVKNRRCICLNCCLYDREGTVDFLETAHWLGGIVSEYHPAHLQHAKATFRVPEDASGRPLAVQKPARTCVPFYTSVQHRRSLTTGVLIPRAASSHS